MAPTNPDEQIARIMQWWNGDYNNDRQLIALRAAGEPVWTEDGSGKGGHIEVTSHYRPVTLPAFGDHVIYVEETKHGDPDNMFRQRIYTLSKDNSGDKVRVKLWYFKDKKAFVGAFKNVSMLSALTPEDMSPLPDKCDLLVVAAGEKLHMPMGDPQCDLGTRVFNYQVLLGADSFWFRDKIENLSDGALLESAGEFTYHELDKQ
ncbi:MAG: CpcT/CpeT family chromophore lyase [Pseudomonadota bacterium]